MEQLRRQIERHDRRLRTLEEWRGDVNPHLTALATMLKDADYGRRMREARAKLWSRLLRTVTAAAAIAAGCATTLHAFGVI